MDLKSLINLINSHTPEFELYFNELINFNSHTNLTAITEKNEVFVKHFLDSILPINEIKQNVSLIDVGSGAGFPGMVIKIVRPDVNLTLLDSLNKRIVFLNQLNEKLNNFTKNTQSLQKNAHNGAKLKNFNKNSTKIVHARAEEYCAKCREQFDVATARAVARLNTLLEYLLPFVRVGGIVLCYKGSGWEEELNEAQNAIKILGGKVEKVIHFNLPNGLDAPTLDAGERNIIVIKKIAPTPNIYPRGQNKPKTQPIK